VNELRKYPPRRRVAVIGSGFGGSVMACRLAESGRFDVEVLERGPRYGRNGFPRLPDQVRKMFWDPDDGYFGPFEWRSFPRSRTDAVAAAGLGGGSLIYSNVLYRVPERLFADWPGGVTRKLLDPYYDRATAMLEGRSYPVDRPDWPYWKGTPKAQALAEAVARIRASPRGHPPMSVEWPPLAVQFGPEPGREVINRQGVAQTTCTMCGECNVGCNTHAKNTLDLNYLARAEAHGALLRTSCAVRAIVPERGGGFTLRIGDPRYRLDRSARGGGDHEERFDLVIVSAGSMGSSELVLGMRRHVKLSPTAGTQVSPNGDILGFVVGAPSAYSPCVGPTITGAIRMDCGSYPDGFATTAWIEDGAFPPFLVWYLAGRLRGARLGLAALRGAWRYLSGVFGGRDGESNVGDDASPLLFANQKWTSNTMMLLGMGRDRSGGTYELRRRRRSVYDRVHLSWDPREGELHYERVRRAMGRIADALGGRFVENPMDDVLHRYITVHPLGGLPLGDSPETGSVDPRTAELYGTKGLFVVDASIFPLPTGPNPSLTIAALAELFAERLCERHA
jgi:cholesterol oxidase